MFWVIVIAVLVIVIVYKSGILRKPDTCQCCGKELTGTEQQVFHGIPNKTSFCLCKDCADKIHPQIYSYAKRNWSYADYTDYIAWEEATRDERAQFKPDVEYGYGSKLKLDTERGLFSIGTGTARDLVFRFADVTDYEMDFKPIKVKEGFIGDKVQGDEFVMFEFETPKIYIEDIVRKGVKLRLRKKGILSSKYEYEFSKGFAEVIRAFTICLYIELERRRGDYQEESVSISEIEKALALFMFDSMDEVTKDSLKKQRNALIKAFHPDNDEQNEAYSQKINAAYELLSSMVKK